MGGLKQEKDEYGPVYRGSKSLTSRNGRLGNNGWVEAREGRIWTFLPWE